ncbi:hypothetical protein G6F35_017116 [Rhizopus arrhizus]|uniref:Uncharacterized protein n=1 Tax=Rhizopus oryzae TaxID=64495 RepID=A0A9P6WRH9_RHIOR|nr:hypothetical protein G6F35_017116 [Rhizopus arrhizus]KAG1218238.1 hypothetical protein G6F68_021622 [Rhizopus microsporus]KAG1273019.1 hypothetical protein G6F64_015431 [Rhizopus arrhizus]
MADAQRRVVGKLRAGVIQREPRMQLQPGGGAGGVHERPRKARTGCRRAKLAGAFRQSATESGTRWRQLGWSAMVPGRLG